MIIGQRGPDLWELAINISRQNSSSRKLLRCRNSGGSGVILGNLSSLAASHEPPLLLWWLPSSGFPNESPPPTLNPTPTMDWIGLTFSPVSISSILIRVPFHGMPIDEDQLAFSPTACGHQWEGGTQRLKCLLFPTEGDMPLQVILDQYRTVMASKER